MKHGARRSEPVKLERIEKELQINDLFRPEHRLAIRIKRVRKIKVNIYLQINKATCYTSNQRGGILFCSQQKTTKIWGQRTDVELLT